MEKRCDAVCLYILFYNNNFLKEIYYMYKCYSVPLLGKTWHKISYLIVLYKTVINFASEFSLL